MKISVFGLGYVGCVTAACLAEQGHHVIGVDINPDKVKLVASGHSPISEPGLEGLLNRMVETGHLIATINSDFAVQESDVSLISVGTPSNHNGCVKLDFIKRVCSQIGENLRRKQTYHVLVIRSTVLPGTVLKMLVPIIEEKSGRKVGTEFGICMNPEFLREGSAINDFYNPGVTVIGQYDQKSGEIVKSIYAGVNSEVIQTSIPVAEMTKYVGNNFHALKITFANEIGTLCKSEGIDGQEVMEIFCKDQRLNVSKAYLRPGFAFGGSCLPKDVRALAHWAKERDVDAPVLSSIISSNHHQIERAIQMIEGTNRNRIAVFGLSFKPATDDVRESPTIALVETLVGRGYKVLIYDEIVNPDLLIGANRAFLDRQLPHIASLMQHSLEEVIEFSEVIVIANGSPGFQRIPKLIRNDQILIDLVGIAKEHDYMRGTYEGICW